MRLERTMVITIWALVFSTVVVQAQSQAADSGNACSLVTTSQVGAALGGDVAAGESTVPKKCRWKQTGPAGLVADLDLWDPKTVDSAKSTATMTRGTVTAVPGLGDDAFYLSRTQVQSEILYVKKGSRAFSVHIMGKNLSSEEMRAKEKALAQNVVAKL
jgi:hypothetical protein